MKRNDRLREIATKAAGDLTKNDKDYITKMSKEMGVAFSPRPHCPNCYADQAVLLWKAVKDADAAHQESPRYILKDGVDVIFGSIRVNSATLTDELAERILARGFDPIYFAKC